MSMHEVEFDTLRGRSIITDGREFGQPWLEPDP